MPRRLPQRIVLTGFMGSGKTTVGRRLAERLGWNFRDLDTEIEQRTASSVPAIFAEYGEPHFRMLEADALAALLGTPETVIALGGGAPETALNRERLSRSAGTAVIYLAAPFRTLLERCVHQSQVPGATARPNLADHVRAGQRFEQREPIYQAIATHTLDTSALDPDAVVDEILRLLEG